ncbi:hypothetical protein [Pleomorphomonas koreensis]|nr:hypothetical protein [Pleomorphomonas koreensis]
MAATVPAPVCRHANQAENQGFQLHIIDIIGVEYLRAGRARTPPR